MIYVVTYTIYVYTNIYMVLGRYSRLVSRAVGRLKVK